MAVDSRQCKITLPGTRDAARTGVAIFGNRQCLIMVPLYSSPHIDALRGLHAWMRLSAPWFLTAGIATRRPDGDSS